MATITSLGSGSGLPLESLLSQLMVAESIPLTTLQTKQSSYQTKISAIGTVTSKLSALQTAANDMMAGIATDPTDKFATYTASVGDTTIASATAGTGATAGSYSLEVTQLATAAKMTSSAVAGSSTSITNTAASLTLNYGGTPFTVNLAANATLANLRDAINNGGSGVTATIITGTAANDGAHLVLTGATGANNTITMDMSSLTGLSGPMSLATTNTPQDASIKLDGIVATSSSNTITTALDGVTINLTAASPVDQTTTPATTTPTTLTVAKSVTDKLTSKVNAFVSAYNAAYSNLSTLTAYNSDTKTAGTLQGNGTMRTVMGQLSKLLTSTTSGNSASAYKTLADIGVSIQGDGTLAVDSSKLNAALAADQKTVAGLVSNVGTAFSGIVDKMTGTSGNITSETTSLNNTVKDITDQESRLQTRLDAIQARYRAQFTALDTLISNLKTTSSYLTSYLSSTTSSSSSSSTG